MQLISNKQSIIKYIETLGTTYTEICLNQRDAVSGSCFDPEKLYIYIDRKQLYKVADRLNLSRAAVKITYILHEAGHNYDLVFNRRECYMQMCSRDRNNKLDLERRAWEFGLLIADILKLNINLNVYKVCYKDALDSYIRYYEKIQAG